MKKMNINIEEKKNNDLRLSNILKIEERSIISSLESWLEIS